MKESIEFSTKLTNLETSLHFILKHNSKLYPLWGLSSFINANVSNYENLRIEANIH